MQPSTKISQAYRTKVTHQSPVNYIIMYKCLSFPIAQRRINQYNFHVLKLSSTPEINYKSKF